MCEELLKNGVFMEHDEAFKVILALKSMKIGEEKVVEGQRIRRVDKHRFDIVNSIGRDRSISMGGKR